MKVYAVVDDLLSSREDAERSIEEVTGDEPALAKDLRIEERELEVGELNSVCARARDLG